MADAVVSLSQSYAVHKTVFDTLTFREPTGALYWTIGPISEVQPTGDEHYAVFWHLDRIHTYAERTLIAPGEASATAMLATLSLADAFKVEKAIKRFFTQAKRSSAPPTSSSGEPEKGSGTSEA